MFWYGCSVSGVFEDGDEGESAGRWCGSFVGRGCEGSREVSVGGEHGQ